VKAASEKVTGMNKKTIQMYFASSLYEAWFSETAHTSGMGSMIITRKTVGGAMVGVNFLCDHFCLGVRDCFAFMESEAKYRSILRGIRDREVIEPANPGYVTKYILGLVQWAKEIGFPPHADYRFCSEILRGIPADEGATFQYGKDGSPFYMNGPYDEPYRIRQIVETLMAYKARTGNEANYAIGGPVPPELFEELERQGVLQLEQTDEP